MHTEYPKNLAIEILKVLRGKRAQATFSKRLGYSFNQVYLWESGRRVFYWADFVKVCEALGISWEKVLLKCFIIPQQGSIHKTLGYVLRGRKKSEVAKSLGVTPSKLSRWVSGYSDPPAEYVLRLFHLVHENFFEFADQLAGVGKVELLQKEILKRKKIQRAYYEMPILGAIGAALDLADYKKLKTHKPGFLAAATGVSLAEEKRALMMLEESGQIRLINGRYETYIQSVDLTTERERFLAICQYWSDRNARLPIANRKRSASSYIVTPISHAAHEKVLLAYHGFYHQLRQILLDDNPLKRKNVMVFNANLFFPEEG